MNFEERLLRFRNELRVRRLSQKLYRARDNIEKAFADMDAVNQEIEKYNSESLTK